MRLDSALLLLAVIGFSCTACCGGGRYTIGVLTDPKHWSTPEGFLIFLVAVIIHVLAVIVAVLAMILRRQAIAAPPPAE